MEFIKYEKIGKEQWQEKIEALEDCPYTYTADWIEFQKEYIINSLIANESFIISQDKEILAVVKVFIEVLEGDRRQISWDSGFIEVPFINNLLSLSRSEKVIKLIMHEIDEISLSYSCKKAMFQFEVLNNPYFSRYFYNYNWLTKFEYLDSSTSAQIICMDLSDEELTKSYRKGTKSEIKKGKGLNIIIKDYSNICEEDIQKCKRIYEYDAGKVTRTSEMIEHYYRLIVNRKGIMGFAELKGERVAVIISAFYKGTAYYLLYAEKTDCAQNTSPGYTLQDRIIKELKRKGVKYYNMGEQVYNKIYGGVDDKVINISLFKRGFGGYTVPFFKGIKMY